MTETKTVTRKLMCQLTDMERQKYGRELADLTFEKGAIESEKKAANDRFKSRLSAVDDRGSVVAACVRDGQERRDVECRWTPDYDTFSKMLIRRDTGEVVETIQLAPDEMQRQLREQDETMEP